MVKPNNWFQLLKVEVVLACFLSVGSCCCLRGVCFETGLHVAQASLNNLG